MPQAIKVAIVGSSYADDSKNIGIQSCINFYPEAVAEGEKSAAALLPVPALSTLVDLEKSDKCRGMHVLSNGLLLVAFGNHLYTGHTPETLSKVNDVHLSGDEWVSIAENSKYACIAVDNIAFIYDVQLNKWQRYVDLPYAVNNVDTLAQRFIFNRKDTGQFFWTDTLSTEINPLSFATAEANPDKLNAIKVHEKQLWLFGDNSTEIWYATGNNDLPFAPMQGAGLQVGCIDVNTIQQFGQSLIWLGNSANGTSQIFMTQGYQAMRISNHALEKQIAKYDRASTHAYTYQNNGHNFYVINFPNDGKTWAFDGTTGKWCERALFKNAQFTTYPCSHHASWHGKHVFSHTECAVLMTHDESGVYNQIGNEKFPHIKERTFNVTPQTKGRIRHHRLTILTEQATGSYELNPKFMLSWSDDEGYSWSDERWSNTGKKGQYGSRTFFTRLGSSRKRAYKLRISDAVRVSITGAELEIS